MRVLDICCGAGGASMGYHLAGFEVAGVDKAPQPDYPFPFTQADAVEFLQGVRFGDYDLIHASPPCQKYCRITKWSGSSSDHPDLIEPVRRELQRIGTPWVMENVVEAPLRRDIVLTGTMFGLRTIRKRVFELGGVWIMQPIQPVVKGGVLDGEFLCITGNGQLRYRASNAEGWTYYKHRKGSIMDTWRDIMQMPWVNTKKGIREAIPPAYTRWIGENLAAQLRSTSRPAKAV